MESYTMLSKSGLILRNVILKRVSTLKRFLVSFHFKKKKLKLHSCFTLQSLLLEFMIIQTSTKCFLKSTLENTPMLRN